MIITDVALFRPAAYSGRTIWSRRQEDADAPARHVLFHFPRQAQLQDNHCPRLHPLHRWDFLEHPKRPFPIIPPHPRTLGSAAGPREPRQRHHENLRRVQILRQELLMMTPAPRPGVETWRTLSSPLIKDLRAHGTDVDHPRGGQPDPPRQEVTCELEFREILSAVTFVRKWSASHSECVYRRDRCLIAFSRQSTLWMSAGCSNQWLL